MSLDAPYKAQARPGVAVPRSAALDFHLWLICLNNSGASGAFTHGSLPGQSHASAPLLIAGVHVGALSGLLQRRILLSLHGGWSAGGGASPPASSLNWDQRNLSSHL